MKRILKYICVFSILLFCWIIFSHIRFYQLRRSPPQKIYIIHDIERKTAVKKNEKLYAHLKPEPVDPEAQFFQTIIENNLFAPSAGNRQQKPPPIDFLERRFQLPEK